MSENSMELSELLPKPLESDKKLKVLFHLFFVEIWTFLDSTYAQFMILLS